MGRHPQAAQPLGHTGGACDPPGVSRAWGRPAPEPKEHLRSGEGRLCVVGGPPPRPLSTCPGHFPAQECRQPVARDGAGSPGGPTLTPRPLTTPAPTQQLDFLPHSSSGQPGRSMLRETATSNEAGSPGGGHGGGGPHLPGEQAPLSTCCRPGPCAGFPCRRQGSSGSDWGRLPRVTEPGAGDSRMRTQVGRCLGFLPAAPCSPRAFPRTYCLAPRRPVQEAGPLGFGALRGGRVFVCVHTRRRPPGRGTRDVEPPLGVPEPSSSRAQRRHWSPLLQRGEPGARGLGLERGPVVCLCPQLCSARKGPSTRCPSPALGASLNGWYRDPVLAPTAWVVLGKGLHLSEPRFPIARGVTTQGTDRHLWDVCTLGSLSLNGPRVARIFFQAAPRLLRGSGLGRRRGRGKSGRRRGPIPGREGPFGQRHL